MVAQSPVPTLEPTERPAAPLRMASRSSSRHMPLPVPLVYRQRYAASVSAQFGAGPRREAMSYG